MTFDDAFSAETRLILSYSPAHLRPIFGGILSLDRQLGAIVAQARDPHLARIRLAWWGEQFLGLGPSSRPADPDLRFAATLVCHHDVKPATLSGLTQGWDLLLGDGGITPEALAAYGKLRGGTIFAIAAQIAGCDVVACEMIGSAWALTDFAFRCSTPETAHRAAEMANTQFVAHPPHMLRRHLMSFALLAHFAKRDLKRGPEQPRPTGHPWRAAQALSFALFG
ncbi:MAG: hypothetical protein ACKVOJ_06825 [Sphingomonadaceae bacterium]